MILLLDMDGTLIDDRGYRAAIDATVVEYCRRHRLPAYPPADDDIHLLHAHGYSNEWDSVAFLLGIIHVETHRGDSAPRPPDYQAWTRQTAGLPGLPNERARQVLLRQAPGELHATIHTLLDHVTDVRRAEVTRTFAEYVIGSVEFARHYGLPAALDTPSFLEKMDQPLIDASGYRVIRQHDTCIYTARPSLAPDGHPPVHPPEAEIGLKLLGLAGLPLVALGQIQWLADQRGASIHELTKPAPVQALAAMLAAPGAGTLAALNAAYELWRYGKLDSRFRSLAGQQVYVAEDNAGGVRACRAAADLLAEHGIAVGVHGLGVAQSAAKRDALAAVCEQLFDNVNDALRSIPAPA